MVDKLGDYGLALWAAEIELRRLEAEAKVRDRRPDEALVGGCRDQRKDLLDAAVYLWREDETVLPILADIRQGTSYVDLADDLTRLAELYGARWDEVKGRSDVNKGNVTRAGQLSRRYGLPPGRLTHAIWFKQTCGERPRPAGAAPRAHVPRCRNAPRDREPKTRHD